MVKLKCATIMLALLAVTCQGFKPLIQKQKQEAVKTARPFLPCTRSLKLQPKAEISYRLPTKIIPSHYKIELTPYLEKEGAKEAFTFDGVVDITISTIYENQKDIILHIHNTIVLDEKKTTISESGLQTESHTAEYPGKDTNDFYKITLDEPLKVNTKYILHLEYTGVLQDDMYGFYRSSYIRDGITKWIASTQFEPTHARKAFPCFDEPHFKATFDIIINRPIRMSSHGNMELKSTEPIPDAKREKDVFHTSPKMSTYLVAFVVSDFEGITNNVQKIGIWARSNAINQGLYAFSIGVELRNAMEDITGIGYFQPETPHMKFDMVAIPDFAVGAMENWGLMTYRETTLLYDAEESSALGQQRVATVVAHEIAHVWFGDLVTCDWWEHTWLNEGFAEYMQYVALAKVIPDGNFLEQFVIEQMQDVFHSDALVTSEAMSSNVGSPASISGHFSSISYNKGGSIIRMLEHTVTTDTFKRALNRYLKSNRLSTAVPDDLFSAVQDQVNEDKTLVNVNIAEFMKSWTEQMGYPVVTVKQTNGKLSVRQERFLLNKTMESPELSWHIPLTYTTKSEKNFANTQPREWLAKDTTEIEIKLDTNVPEWVIFNLYETGYYRVNYDDKTWELISAALQSIQFDGIPELNRAQIVDDLCNLARAGILKYDFVFDILDYLKTENSYFSWYAAFNGFAYMHQRLNADVLKSFEGEVLKLLSPIYEDLGFDSKRTDSRVDIYNRAQILSWTCKLEHEECVATAKKEFDEWMEKGTRILPDVRPVVYCTAIRNGGKDKWDTLWKKYEKENVGAEQLVILSALGCTKDKAILNEYLQKSLTEESGIRKQDAIAVFKAVYTANRENVAVAFDFLKENYKKISVSYGGMSALGTCISGIADRLITFEEVEQMEKFLEEHADELKDVAEGAASAIEAAKANLEWSKSYSNVIGNYITDKNLRNRGEIPAGSVTVMCILVIGLFWV